MLTTGLSEISIILKCIPSLSCLFGTFDTKNYWILTRSPSTYILMVMWFTSDDFYDILHLLICICWPTPAPLEWKQHHCEWYFWCVLEFGLLAFYWWFLHLCAPWNNETAYKVSILLLPLVHTFTCCHVFVSSWYQEDADFVSRIWQHSIFHYFTEQFEND